MEFTNDLELFCISIFFLLFIFSKCNHLKICMSYIVYTTISFVALFSPNAIIWKEIQKIFVLIALHAKFLPTNKANYFK